MDLSRLSDKDLEALARNDFAALSDEALASIAGGQPPAPPPRESRRLENFLGGMNEKFSALAGPSQLSTLAERFGDDYPELRAAQQRRNQMLLGRPAENEQDAKWRRGGGVAADSVLASALPLAGVAANAGRGLLSAALPGSMAPSAVVAPTSLPASAPLSARAGETARTMADQMMRSTAARPGAMFAQDAAGSIGAGIGSTAENETIGALSGGLLGAGSVGLGQAVLPKAFQAYQVASPAKFMYDLSTDPINTVRNRGAKLASLAKPRVERKAAKEFTEAIEGSGGAAAREVAIDAEQRVGLSGQGRLTMAEATSDPELIRLQRNMEDKASGGLLRMAVDRRQAVESGVDQFAGSRFADDIPDPEELARRQLAGTTGKIDAQLTGVEQRQAALGKSLPRTDRAAVGSSIRDDLKAAKATEKGRMRQLAEDYGLNEEVKFSMDDLAKSIDDTFQSSTEFGRRMPATKAKLENYYKRQFGPEDGPTLLDASGAPLAARRGDAGEVSLQDLQGIRSEIGDDIGRVLASDDPAKSRNLAELLKLRDSVDDYIATGAPSKLRPELAKNWEEFRGAYKQYADQFERGPVYRVLARQYRGADGLKTVDEKVAREFLTPTGAKQYLDAGGKPEHIRAALMDDASRLTVRGGQINTSRYETWLSNNEQTLRAYGMYDEFADRLVSGQSLARRAGDLESRKRLVQQSDLAKAVESAGRGNSDELVAKALRDPTMMRQLQAIAAKAGVKDAVPAAVWNAVVKEAANDPAALTAAMKKYDKALKVALTPRHLEDVNALVTIGERLALTQGQRGAKDPSGIDTQLRKQLGSGIMEITSRVYAMARGFRGANYAKVDLALRFFSRQYMDAYDQVMFRAMSDPQVASDILTSSKMAEKAPREALNRLRPYLFAAGIDVAAMEAIAEDR
jgi:hypothetical protein